MLFVANFSYSNYDEEFENACLMPAVVDAPDYETAIERFQALLRRFHDESPLLDGAESIYLDSLVALSEPPTEPVMIQWQKLVASAERLYADTVPLPGGDEIAQAYNLSGAEEDDEDEGERVALVDEDDADEAEALEDDASEGELADGDEELSPEDLADAISQALDYLFSGELVDTGDDLDANEEPFITFED